MSSPSKNVFMQCVRPLLYDAVLNHSEGQSRHEAFLWQVVGTISADICIQWTRLPRMVANHLRRFCTQVLTVLPA